MWAFAMVLRNLVVLNCVQDAIVHMDMVINAEYTRIYNEEKRIQVRPPLAQTQS